MQTVHLYLQLVIHTYISIIRIRLVNLQIAKTVRTDFLIIKNKNRKTTGQVQRMIGFPVWTSNVTVAVDRKWLRTRSRPPHGAEVGDATVGRAVHAACMHACSTDYGASFSDQRSVLWLDVLELSQPINYTRKLYYGYGVLVVRNIYWIGTNTWMILYA